MDHATATALNIPLCAMNDPPCLSTMDGGPIGEGTICCVLSVHREDFLSYHKLLTRHDPGDALVKET